MTTGKRPGGLTALAVLNFVFGGFSALGVLGLIAIWALLNVATKHGDAGSDDAMQKVADAWGEIGVGVLLAMLVLSVVNAVLLIASGIGYLQQRRFLGRTLGNTYSVLSILSSLVGSMVVTSAAGGGFNIGTMVGLIYPILTLALLNGTFKEDFVN